MSTVGSILVQVIVDVIVSVFVVTWILERRDSRRTQAARNGCHALVVSALLELEQALTGLTGSPFRRVEVDAGSHHLSSLGASPAELTKALEEPLLLSDYHYARLQRAQDELSLAISASAALVRPSLMESCLRMRVAVDTLLEYFETAMNEPSNYEDPEYERELKENLREVASRLKGLREELAQQPHVRFVESPELVDGARSEAEGGGRAIPEV